MLALLSLWSGLATRTIVSDVPCEVGEAAFEVDGLVRVRDAMGCMDRPSSGLSEGEHCVAIAWEVDREVVMGMATGTSLVSAICMPEQQWVRFTIQQRVVVDW